MTRLLDNLLKLEHHAGLNWADESWKLATANVALRLVLTMLSTRSRNSW